MRVPIKGRQMNSQRACGDRLFRIFGPLRRRLPRGVFTDSLTNFSNSLSSMAASRFTAGIKVVPGQNGSELDYRRISDEFLARGRPGRIGQTAGGWAHPSKGAQPQSSAWAGVGRSYSSSNTL